MKMSLREASLFTTSFLFPFSNHSTISAMDDSKSKSSSSTETEVKGQDDSTSTSSLQDERNNNPCCLACCNLLLSQGLQLLALILLILTTLSLGFFIYVALNTESYLSFYQDVIALSVPDDIHKFESGIRAISYLLVAKEAVFLSSTMALLLVGARYKKYEFLKAWLIFTSFHETFGLMAHVILALFLQSPLLCLHLPLTLSVLSVTAWLTSLLMKEIKTEEIRRREGSPRLKRRRSKTKAKVVYSGVGRMRSLNGNYVKIDRNANKPDEAGFHV